MTTKIRIIVLKYRLDTQNITCFQSMKIESTIIIFAKHATYQNMLLLHQLYIITILIYTHLRGLDEMHTNMLLEHKIN